MQPWFTVYVSDIGHPCYDELTPVKTRNPLTGITLPYRGFKFVGHRDHVLFWKLTAVQVLVFRWSAFLCLSNLLKTGQDCSEGS